LFFSDEEEQNEKKKTKKKHRRVFSDEVESGGGITAAEESMEMGQDSQMVNGATEDGAQAMEEGGGDVEMADEDSPRVSKNVSSLKETLKDLTFFIQ
jgi:thiamine biosynthesis protein ThiC